MKQDHRFGADAPVYLFRGGEHACVRIDAGATDGLGDDFTLEVKDVSTFGFIAVSARLPITGEAVTVRLPGLEQQRACVAYCDGHWAAYSFEQELDWALVARTLLASGGSASRAAAA